MAADPPAVHVAESTMDTVSFDPQQPAGDGALLSTAVLLCFLHFVLDSWSTQQYGFLHSVRESYMRMPPAYEFWAARTAAMPW